MQITECVVGCLFSTQVNNGLDLDMPRLITPQEGINDWPEEQRRGWLRENGYDLSVDMEGGNTVWSHAVYTNLTVVSNDRWEDDSLAWVAQTLQPGDLAGELVFWSLPKQPFPLTFAFHTADGTAGLFRVTAYSTEEKTVTIQVRKEG